MSTYGKLFRSPEFSRFFGAGTAQIAADAITGLALSTLVYSRTGSPLLSALSLFGKSFAQVIGALTLLSAADRLRPRAALSVVATVFAAGSLVLAIPGLPVLALLMIVLGLGLVNSLAGGVRWGLLKEIVPPGSFVLGRSLFTTSLGVMQILGYAVGGLLIAATSPRRALLLGAGLYLLAAVVLRFGLTDRPSRSSGRPSIGETWRVDKQLWLLPGRRHVYLALWVPNGLIVGCEAVFVPYAGSSAEVLFMGSALGMLVGNIVMGRFVSQRWRSILFTPMRFLLAVPFLVFAFPVPLHVAAVAVATAGLGFSAGLLLQNTLVGLTPGEIRGQALGLHSAGLLTMQAIGGAMAGAVAEYVAAGPTMVIMATASAVVTLALIPGLRRSTETTDGQALPERATA